MKLSIKIWLLAICYQVIIFCVIINDAGLMTLVFIPIGLIGGLPSLLIFDAILKKLQKNNDSIKAKWFYLILTTIFAAIAPSSLLIILLCISLNNPSIEIMPIIPAPIAAIGALFTFTIPLQKSFSENVIKTQ